MGRMKIDQVEGSQAGTAFSHSSRSSRSLRTICQILLLIFSRCDVTNRPRSCWGSGWAWRLRRHVWTKWNKSSSGGGRAECFQKRGLSPWTLWLHKRILDQCVVYIFITIFSSKRTCNLKPILTNRWSRRSMTSRKHTRRYTAWWDVRRFDSNTTQKLFRFTPKTSNAREHSKNRPSEISRWVLNAWWSHWCPGTKELVATWQSRKVCGCHGNRLNIVNVLSQGVS